MALRPIINPDAPTIVKVDPNISFSQDEFDIYEKNLKGVYEFDWFQYLVNTDNVGYSVKLSDGLIFIDDSKFTWSDSGNYTLTVTTTENDYYNSIDIVMTFHIYTLSTSGVEYIPNPLEIVDGDLQIEYFNVEKREGVYMFDLIKPNNPNSLNVKYKIEGKYGCTIDDDDYKVHIAKKGKYKITAYFEGNSSYRPSETVYYLVYGQDGDEDDKDPYDNQDDTNTKKYPNISFSKSSVSFNKNNTSIYDVLKANNPNNVQLTYTSDTGNLIEGDTKIQVPEDFTGNIKITCTSTETSEYYSQTITYIITISIPEEEKSDEYDFYFSQDTDNQIVKQSHKYTVLHLTNTSGLDYTLTVSKPATVSADKTEIECGITGSFIVIAKTIPDSIYKSKEARYTLNIQESEKQVPVFEFTKTQDTWQQNKDGNYPILALNNPNNLEYTISCNNPSASIQDNMLYFNELGTITITATSKETDEYISVSAMYILYIIEATKQNAGISFTYDRINIKKLADETGGYPVQELNNPNNVALNPYIASSGSVRDGRLYVNGPTELYIQVTSIEDDNYFATTARYTVNIYTELKSYPNFQVHNDYEIIDNLNKTKNIELLRWPKSDNLSFNSSEWRVSVSKPICTISNITMTETDTDCVLYGDIKFSEEGYVRCGITFNGNAEWESASNMGLNIRYTRKTLISPELSFPNYYVIVDQSATNTYVIQEVLNPFDVEVNYYVSNGDLNGNILTFNGTGNIIVTCTSVETDVYASQSVQYTLHINKPKKISPELSFEYPLKEYEQGSFPNNEYELQDVINPHNVPIKSWSATNQAIVYYNNGHCVKYNGTGDVIVSVTSQETAVYYSETVYYTMRIVESSSLLDPELYYDPNFGEVYVNDEGQYELPQPHLADESLRPLLTFRTENNLGSVSDDGTMLSVDGTWNVRVYTEFAGDGTYRAASASYVLRIQAKPAKHLPDIMFRDQRVSFNSRGANGEYELQTTFVGAQADIGGEYYVNQAGVTLDITNHKIYYPDNSGDIIIYYKTNETDEYLSAIINYEVLISQYSLKYLDAELIQSNVDITGPYNTDIEIRAIKWLKSKNYTFNASEWKITTTESSCTPKIVRSESLDANYNVLVISCAFSSEKRAPLRITFLGDDEFYSQSDFNILYVDFTRAKSTPNYYFSPANVNLTMGTPGNVYKLSDYTQLRGVPSDLDVNVELLSNSPDTFTDGVVTINRHNVNSFFIRAWNNETNDYNDYSTQFHLAWTNQYIKGNPDLTFKNKVGGVLNFYWDPNNKYIVEINNPYGVEIPESDIIWDTEGFASVRPLGNYRYEVSLYDNTNEIHQFRISFITRETLEYESVTDYAIFSISEYDRTDVDYTMHAYYNYDNITVGETITGVELLEFIGDDVGTVNDFEVTVQPNDTINYISVSNVRIIDNKLICDVRTWSLADIGSNNIYVRYKGNSLHNSFLDYLNFAYSNDTQYVRYNVISVTFNEWPVEQNIPDNNYYDLQPINDVYGISPTVYYEEDNCDRITEKIYTDGIGDYTVTAYTNSIVKDDILYKATRIQYTFQLIRNTHYFNDGSLYFDNSSEVRDQNVQGKYPLQGVTNSGMWTLEWFAEDALGNEVTISDGYINYNDLGLITITVRTVDAYPRREASYTLLVREALGADPELSFNGDVNYRLSERYIIDKPNDPNNLLQYCTISASNGSVTHVGDEYYLTGNYNIGDIITISCYFPGNSTYNSTEISYRITITSATGSSNLLIRKRYNEPDEEYYDYFISYTNLSSRKNIAYLPQPQEYNSKMFNFNDFSITSKNNDNYTFTTSYSFYDNRGVDKRYVDFYVSNIYNEEGPYNCDYILPLTINFKGNEKYAPNTLDYNMLISRIPSVPRYVCENLGPVFKGKIDNFERTTADNYIVSQFVSYLPYDESGEYYIDSSYNYMFSYDYVSNPNNIQSYNRYMTNSSLVLGRRYDGSKEFDCLYLINPDPRYNSSYCIVGKHINHRYPETEISVTSRISFAINTRTINIGNLIPNTIKIKRNESGVYDLSKVLPLYTNYISYSTYNYRGNKINVGIRYALSAGYNKDGDTIVSGNSHTYANINENNLLILRNYNNNNYNTVDFVYRIYAALNSGYIENTSKNKYKLEGNVCVNITLSNDVDAIDCSCPVFYYGTWIDNKPIYNITIPQGNPVTEIHIVNLTGISNFIYHHSSDISVADAYNSGYDDRIIIRRIGPGTCIFTSTMQGDYLGQEFITPELHVTCT